MGSMPHNKAVICNLFLLLLGAGPGCWVQLVAGEWLTDGLPAELRIRG